MPTLRDIRRQARGDLHALAKVPVVFIPKGQTTGTQTYARVHAKIKLNSLDDGNAVLGAASMWDSVPTIKFWRNELEDESIVLAVGAIVSVEAGEAYRIESVQPPEDSTTTVTVSRLTADRTIGLQVPT